jgi:serine/threonine-protein kinase
MSAVAPTTGLWREALAQVDTLLQQPPEARELALAGLAAAHPDLHALVAALLAADVAAEARNFLEPARAHASEHALREGMTLGPYRIVARLGTGGMGEVWLARRDDGLYQGDVAIKTLHPYLARGTLRERILREASLLGRLTHPNVARLLDAGVSPDGLVYLVIEYVRGVAIDAWCDEYAATVHDRLRLFVDVCAAVAHAHANLIVHRDIKPPNILVDGAGVPKLLDFGVAKLIEADARAERTELTRLTGRVFTPEYAAPEQILGHPVTTATDVYSLGVLLHTLLAGVRPFANVENPTAIEHAVLHDDPARPSRAVASAPDIDGIAAKRSTTPRKLHRALTGDLDSIVARAMRKSPAERYASVLNLAEDVRRHLDHQPILARPDPVFVRARKFARRHRIGVAASVLVIGAIAAGVAGVVWQAQVARVEARKATAIKDFLVGVFERNSTAHPDGAKARQTTAEELLAQSAQQIRTGLTEAPEVRSELLGVMGRLYASLEMQKEALPLLEERLALQRRELGGTHSDVAKTLSDLANSQLQNGDYPAALRSANEALRIFRANRDEVALEHALAHATLGQVSYRLGTARDGRMRRHFETARDLLAAHHPRSSWRLEMQTGLAREAQSAGDHEAALRHDQEAVRLFESGEVDADGLARGGAYQSLGNSLNWVSRNEEAERYLRKAIVEFERAGGPAHPYTIDGRRELGSFLGWIGRRTESKATLEDALAAQIKARGADDPQLTSVIRLDLGRVLMMRGEYAAAERELQQVIKTWKASGASILAPTMHLARIHTEQGRFDLLVQELDDVEAKVEKRFGKSSWWHAVAINRLAAWRLAQGNPDDARGYFVRLREGFDREGEFGPNRAYAEVGILRVLLAQRSAELIPESRRVISQIESSRARGDMPDEEAGAHMLLGAGLLRGGRIDEARNHLERAVSMRASMDAPDSPLLAEARLYLAQQRHLGGDRGAARALLREAEAACLRSGAGPQYLKLLADTKQITSRR